MKDKDSKPQKIEIKINIFSKLKKALVKDTEGKIEVPPSKNDN